MPRLVAVLMLAVLVAAPVRAAWAPPGVDLARPRLLLRPGDVPVIQARLDREPYLALLAELLLRIRQADGIGLDDHTISAERIKARAAKCLAFQYAIDRTLVAGAAVPFATPAARAAAAERVRSLLLNMYTRSRLAVPAPLGGFDRDINTTEELQQYATAYDTLRGAGFDFGPDEAAIVGNLAALAGELYENYRDPASAGDYTTLHHNNHRSKSGAALAVAGIALAEYTPEPGSDPRGVREPAAWIDYGLDQADLVMRIVLVTGDGAYAEGPFYLRYAAQNLLPFWRAWDRLLDGAAWTTASGVEVPSYWRHPLLARSLQWALDLTVPDGSLAPTDDGNVGEAFYFGAAPTTPAFAWRWANAPRRYETDGSISLAADALVLYDDAIVPAEPPGSPTAFYLEGGQAVLRSDWSPDAVLAIVQGEHLIASEFGRDRDGQPVGPQSHEHAEPGAFLLHAFGERLALDPGYLTFAQRGLVSKPEDHNLILVDGAGPLNYLAGSLAWLQNPLAGPPVDGHATLSQPLDGAAVDAVRVSTRYGQPAARAARITRDFVFADDRYLFIADAVDGPDETPRRYTWLLHGNGGGSSGGSFAATAHGARWERPGAVLETAFAVDAGTPQVDSVEATHEGEDRARLTHTTWRASVTGTALRSVQLVYPLPAGAAAPIVADLGWPDVAGVSLDDPSGDRRVLAWHRATAGAPLVVPEDTVPNLATARSDGRSALFDAHSNGGLRLAWADDATSLSYGEFNQLRSRTRGRLSLSRPSDQAIDLIVDTADPLVALDELAFEPQAADGACGLTMTDQGAAIVLGRERRIGLRRAPGNSRPAADPGPPLRAMPPTVVALDGGGSCDVDGDALTPRWDLVSAPAGSAWSLEATDSWTPRLFVDRAGPYRVRLVVTDAAGADSLPAEVLILGGEPCADGVDNDLDGLFDGDDADCDALDQPIADGLGRRGLDLRVGAVARFDLGALLVSPRPLTLQAASTDPSAASAELTDGVLSIRAHRLGAARIHVSADDGAGERTHDVVAVAVAGAPACGGDCDADGAVTIDEILAGVAIALGDAPFERCAALDENADGIVGVPDLIAAVRRALDDC
ncbi:MAG: heparinase II/III domain-containing protein [Candidatus Binatia bacterium]